MTNQPLSPSFTHDKYKTDEPLSVAATAPSLYGARWEDAHERQKTQFWKAIESDALPAPLRDAFVRFWQTVTGNVPGVLRFPTVGLMDPDGEKLLLTWDQGELHLDVEIHHSLPVAEFFFYNRRTKETQEWDWDENAPSFPDTLRRKLNAFRVAG